MPSILVPALFNIFLDSNCSGNDNAFTRAVSIFVVKKPTCSMRYNLYLPFKYDYNPLKMLINFYQLSCQCVLAVGVSGICSSILEAVNFIVLQLKQLKQNLCVSFNGSHVLEETQKQIKIREWIQTHQNLINIIRLFKSVYSVAIWLRYEKLFLFKYYMYKQSEKLVEAINLGIKWYKETRQIQKILHIILLRSQHPFLLNAGPFSILSPELFSHDGHVIDNLPDMCLCLSAWYAVFVVITTKLKMPKIQSLLHNFNTVNDAFINGRHATVWRKSKDFHEFLVAFITNYTLFSYCVYGLMNVFLDEKCPWNSHNNHANISEIPIDGELSSVVNNGAAKKLTCGMVNNMYIPFDHDDLPIRTVVNAFQMVAVILMAVGCTPSNAAILECVNYMNAQIRDLNESLREIFANENCKNSKQKLELLHRWIEKHQFVIRQSDLLNDAFSILMFSHVLLTSTIMAAYLYITIKHLQMFIAFQYLAFMTALGMVCLAGHLLTSESESIEDVIRLDIEWYEEDVSIQKDLVIILLRLQHPFVIQAGPVSTLTLALFIGILKSSYSFMLFIKDIENMY